jgi:hypothetical protein
LPKWLWYFGWICAGLGLALVAAWYLLPHNDAGGQQSSQAPAIIVGKVADPDPARQNQALVRG